MMETAPPPTTSRMASSLDASWDEELTPARTSCRGDLALRASPPTLGSLFCSPHPHRVFLHLSGWLMATARPGPPLPLAELSFVQA